MGVFASENIIQGITMNNSITSEEIEAKVSFLSSSKCNHTYHKYVDITGDLVEGTLLSRILYWFSPDKNQKSKVRIFRDGYFWIAKQRKDWWEEIRITERQYDKAINGLKEKGFVVLAKYKFNSMPTIHIRPNYDVINKAVEKWEDEIRQEIIKEYNDSVLLESENGNNAKCNFQGNYTKCDSGITQESNLLTGITNNDYDINNDYCSDNTKEQEEKKGRNNSENCKVETSVPEKQKHAHRKSKYETYLELKEKEKDMLNRAYDICRKEHSLSEDMSLEVVKIIDYYLSKYTQKTGNIHPILGDKALSDIISVLYDTVDTEYGHFENLVECESYMDIIDEFFKTDFGQRTGERTDYHLSHFATEGVISRLAQRLV